MKHSCHKRAQRVIRMSFPLVGNLSLKNDSGQARMTKEMGIFR
jgi:hypothetical protein